MCPEFDPKDTHIRTPEIALRLCIASRRKMLPGQNLNLTEDPHRRLNALTNEWVLVSPHRATRPWQGEVAQLPAASEPAYDPTCYLCPGNPRAGGIRNPAYATTFVFENDF